MTDPDGPKHSGVLVAGVFSVPRCLVMVATLVVVSCNSLQLLNSLEGRAGLGSPAGLPIDRRYHTVMS